MNNSPITIKGNATKDAELATTATGSSKATFAVAVENRYQKNDEWVSETSFFNVVAWRWLADDVARNVRKGSRVLVSGRLQQRSYEDSNDGSTKYVVELIADDVALSVGGVQSYERRTKESANAGASQGGAVTSNVDDGSSLW